MKQLEKYSSFNELKSSNKSDSFSVEQELRIKELYSLLQRAANSGNSSIQKNPKNTWILFLNGKQSGKKYFRNL